jgi:hypothetical protein
MTSPALNPLSFNAWVQTVGAMAVANHGKIRSTRDVSSVARLLTTTHLQDAIMAENKNSKFYVYEHWRPDTEQPFYVGKGRKHRNGRSYRAFAVKWSRNPHHKNVVNLLSRLGMKVDVRIVATFDDETAAFAYEIERISFWRSRGVKLTNLTDGGDGASGVHVGRVFSPESIDKMRAAQKARVAANPDLHRSLVEAARIANRDPEVRAKTTAARLAVITGKPHTIEARLKMSAATKGRKPTQSQIDNLKPVNERRAKEREASRALLAIDMFEK